jgi:hypothetical protein
MLTKNQVNFFEGGSINKGEMAYFTISWYSSLLCPMVNKKIIHKRYFRIVGKNRSNQTSNQKFINTRLSIKILEMKLHIQSSVKSFGKRKKNPYFIKKLL